LRLVARSTVNREDGGVPNRLASSASPYLQQHADNPVDWYEWGDEAFEAARQREVPVLLSVGYAACHWCHVMAHESFEDQATAEEMNAGFVNIKVDREERPDVDAVYMAATQALTGQGGWPMTVFLTPDGRPFFAGTYFPARPRYRMPAFRQVLAAVSQSWRERRTEVEQAGRQIAEALSRQELPAGTGPPDAGQLASAVRVLAAAEDTEYGGFGGAPKFPPAMVCEFLLRHAARLKLSASGDATGELAAGIASRTLLAMAHSGMYDQVAGGFARYSTDRAWVVPHFEKMLYDNALLARAYLHWWRLTGEPTGARIAVETCEWMLAGLRTARGGFASSLDADTPIRGRDGAIHGVEGFTYVWTPEQLIDELGADDGAWAARLLRVTPEGTFEHGTSTLQLGRDVWADEAESERWRTIRGRLSEARVARPQPTRDDKVVAAWNGLAIAALAETGSLLQRPDLLAAAEQAADHLLSVHLAQDGTGGGRRLRRVSRDGVTGASAGVLEDYGDLAEGLIALHAATGSAGWLRAAGRLLDVVLEAFRDGSSFFDTPADGTDAPLETIRRPEDPTDNAYPSGRSAAAGALLAYAALTGEATHREAAEAALAIAGGLGHRSPQSLGWALAVAEALADGPREVAVAGPQGPARRALHAVALAGTAPGCVISVGEPDTAEVPLLAGRQSIGGDAAAYVCRGFVCDAPVTDLAALAASVGARM
jgi:uncharacterized protein YyaL (SSP411 family)